MKCSITYLDIHDEQACLTHGEIDYFFATVYKVLAATGITISVTPFNHDTVQGHREALGLYWWSDTDPTGFITIDTYFIHECYGAEREGRHSLEPQTLTDVICHELAHIAAHRHGKRHTALTEQYKDMVLERSGLTATAV